MLPNNFELLKRNRIIHKPLFNAKGYFYKNKAEFNQLIKRYGDKLKNSVIGPVEVGKSGIHQWGLFALEDLKVGDWIGEYTGEQRWALPFSRKTDYSWRIPAPTFPPLEINASRCGNILRFANHSFEPNAICDHIFFEGAWSIIFYTQKNIKKGEEIFIDYGEEYWETPHRELHITAELFQTLKNQQNPILEPSQECKNNENHFMEC